MVVGTGRLKRRQVQTGLEEMRRGRNITGWLAGGILALALAAPFPCPAQRGFAPPQRRTASAYQAPRQQTAPRQQQSPRQQPAPRQQGPRQQPPNRQQQVNPQPRGHAGDWLRRYKDLPPQEQERELQNDPGFRRLPPERQQQLRQRLQHFSSLPPQQQLRVLNRMETWEHLTPEQKQQARQVFSQMKQLPPARQRMVTTAVRDLRAMPPEQREQIINSPRFRGMFSDQERELMRGAARLPLAPAEEGGPQE